MIGTNNRGIPELHGYDTAYGILALMKEIHAQLPKSKILLMPIFPRGKNPQDTGRLRNLEINEIIKTYVDGKTVSLARHQSRLPQRGRHPENGTHARLACTRTSPATASGQKPWNRRSRRCSKSLEKDAHCKQGRQAESRLLQGRGVATAR